MDHDTQPLPPGTLAPTFALHRTPGHTLPLRRLAGGRVVLVFYPSVFEPVSREQLMLYQEFLPEFDRLRAQVVGIAADHAWCQEQFAREAGITFPLLADMSPVGKVSQMYGVYRDAKDTTSRALFVIDSWGVIRFSQAYPDVLNPGVDEPLTVLEALNEEAERNEARDGARSYG